MGTQHTLAMALAGDLPPHAGHVLMQLHATHDMVDMLLGHGLQFTYEQLVSAAKQRRFGNLGAATSSVKPARPCATACCGGHLLSMLVVQGTRVLHYRCCKLTT